MKSAIRKCLNLALIFTSNLERGVQFTRFHICLLNILTVSCCQCVYVLSSCRVETADRIERDYEQCNKFLVSFLLSLVRRGSYPHCELFVYSVINYTLPVFSGHVSYFYCN